MVPCCLNLITREEHDRLVELDKTNRLIGGAVGKHHFCPKDAPEAHQAVTGFDSFHNDILPVEQSDYEDEFNAFVDCCNGNWNEKCTAIRIDCSATESPGK